MGIPKKKCTDLTVHSEVVASTIAPAERHVELDLAEINRFCEALGYEEGEELYFRAISRKGARKYTGTYPLEGTDTIRALCNEQTCGKGVYLVVNGGGHRDSDVQTAKAIWYEHDDIPVPEQVRLWKRFGLPEPTIQVFTGGKSIHSYWVLAEPLPIATWQGLQTDLIDLVGGDRTVRNPSRVMRLPGGIHQATGLPSEILSVSRNRYSYDELRGSIPMKGAESRPSDPIEDRSRDRIPLTNFLGRKHSSLIANGSPQGQRNNTGAALARNLVATADYLDTIQQPYTPANPRDLFEDYCARCTPPLEASEAEQIWWSARSATALKPCLSPGRIAAAISGNSTKESSDIEADDLVLVSQEVRELVSFQESELDLDKLLNPSLATPLKLLARSLNKPASAYLGGLLAHSCSLLDNRIRIVVNQGTNHKEPPILWVALVGASGDGKSHLGAVSFLPLLALQAAETQRFNESFKRFKEEADKAKNVDGRPDIGPEPKKRNFFFSNFTWEALISGLAGEPNKSTVVSVDELEGFFRSFGEYKGGGGADRQRWLDAYGGRGVKLDRKTSGSTELERTSVSIYGSIQWDTLSRQIKRDGGAVDGFWSRFTFFCLPPKQITPFPDDEMNLNLSERISGLFLHLDKVPAMDFRFSKRARARFKDWHYEVQALWQKESDSALSALYGKLAGRTARIALLLHLINHAAEGESSPPTEVSEKTMESAIYFSRWEARQATLVFSGTGSSESPHSPALLKLLSTFSGRESFSRRDVMRAIRSLESANAASRLIEVGVLAGLIRELPKNKFRVKRDSVTKKGGKPSPTGFPLSQCAGQVRDGQAKERAEPPNRRSFSRTKAVSGDCPDGRGDLQDLEGGLVSQGFAPDLSQACHGSQDTAKRGPGAGSSDFCHAVTENRTIGVGVEVIYSGSEKYTRQICREKRLTIVAVGDEFATCTAPKWIGPQQIPLEDLMVVLPRDRADDLTTPLKSS